MQARLLPPVDDRIQAFPADGWEREFSLAYDAGVEGIEWIYEVHGEEANPLASDTGLARLAELCAEHGVALESLCADWFMDRPLLRAQGAEREARVEKLRWLLGRARAAGVRRIILPFVDASSLHDDRDLTELGALLARLIGALEETSVELHLETDLAPAAFAELLATVPHPLIKVNYDTGNSASLGHDPREELRAYGERIGSVHVKDRSLGGGTVPLGEGAADLELVFSLLQERGWKRPLVLQVARGEPGAEVEHVRAYAEQVRETWRRALRGRRAHARSSRR